MTTRPAADRSNSVRSRGRRGSAQNVPRRASGRHRHCALVGHRRYGIARRPRAELLRRAAPGGSGRPPIARSAITPPSTIRVTTTIQATSMGLLAHGKSFRVDDTTVLRLGLELGLTPAVLGSTVFSIARCALPTRAWTTRRR